MFQSYLFTVMLMMQVFLWFILTAGPFIGAQFPPPPTSALLGIEVGARPPAFCNVVEESRPFSDDQSKAVDVDENGWPKADGKMVVFDLRPTFAWNPPIDDPEKKIPQSLDGVWKLSFSGLTNVSIGDSLFSGTITNVMFDNTTNITTADINYPEGEGLMCLTSVTCSIHHLTPKEAE